MSGKASRRQAAVVLLAALAGAAGTARLGVWQLDRAAQKTALQAVIDERSRLPALPAGQLARTEADAAAQWHRPTRVAGRWFARGTVFLDNRQMDGRPGFYVLTPLQLDGSDDAVLVQRGWVPRNLQDRTVLPDVATPAGSVEVTGRIAPFPARLYEFGTDAGGPIRQNIDAETFARELGIALRAVSVLQADSPSAAGDGLLRHWPRPAVDVSRNHGYAFQWFALSALITGLYVWFQLLRPRLRRSARR